LIVVYFIGPLCIFVLAICSNNVDEGRANEMQLVAVPFYDYC